MARRLRTRWETTMLRFDRNPSDPTNRYDVINTAQRLKNLAGAIKRMTRATYWEAMRLDTRMEFFSLLLDIIRDVVRRDCNHYGGRGSPYALQSAIDVNLYQRLIGQSQDVFAVKVLRIMIKRKLGVPLLRQIAYIDEIIRELSRRPNVRPGSSVSGRSSASSGSSGVATSFGGVLLKLRESESTFSTSLSMSVAFLTLLPRIVPTARSVKVGDIGSSVFDARQPFALFVKALLSVWFSEVRVGFGFHTGF